MADAEDILPPGSYRFDLVDGNGESLDVTVQLTVGASRSVEVNERDSELGTPTTEPTFSMASDTRMIIDANMRAMQMSFLHNQRMLEIAVRMVETLRDSVQVLATSQAEWIKSMASGRESDRGDREANPPAGDAPDKRAASRRAETAPLRGLVTGKPATPQSLVDATQTAEAGESVSR